MRTLLDNELKSIHVEIIKMGTQIEKAIDETMMALINQDVDLAKAVIIGDKKFNQKQVEIEDKCINVIALQQPVATDLRTLLSVLKIVTDLERIADHCKDISELTIDLANVEYVKPLIDIPNMAKVVKNMVKQTIDCYIDRDVEKARVVCKTDEQVNTYFREIFSELDLIMKGDPESNRQCLDFLMIAKYLERMGDHSTNIAEWVIYGVEGQRL